MTLVEVKELVLNQLKTYCEDNNLTVTVSEDTALIGSEKIMDSIGLVNFIVDLETEFLDRDLEISLTSEAAMSSRISPFRSVGAIAQFIHKQLNE